MLQVIKYLIVIVTISFVINYTALAQDSKAKIEWKTFEEVETLMKTQPKKIVVYFYTDWCGWCKKMEKNTFSNPELSNYLNEHYYAIKFNAEQKEPVMFNGKKYSVTKVGNRFANEIAVEMLHGQLGYPATILLDENYTELNTFTGYMEIYKMEPILKYVGEGLYANTEWNKWFRDFKPSWTN